MGDAVIIRNRPCARSQTATPCSDPSRPLFLMAASPGSARIESRPVPIGFPGSRLFLSANRGDPRHIDHRQAEIPELVEDSVEGRPVRQRAADDALPTLAFDLEAFEPI
jgi:hypothetical protein